MAHPKDLLARSDAAHLLFIFLLRRTMKLRAFLLSPSPIPFLMGPVFHGLEFVSVGGPLLKLRRGVPCPTL